MEPEEYHTVIKFIRNVDVGYTTYSIKSDSKDFKIPVEIMDFISQVNHPWALNEAYIDDSKLLLCFNFSKDSHFRILGPNGGVVIIKFETGDNGKPIMKMSTSDGLPAVISCNLLGVITHTCRKKQATSAWVKDYDLRIAYDFSPKPTNLILPSENLRTDSASWSDLENK